MRSNFVLQLLLVTDDHALTWIKGVVRVTMRNEKRYAYIAFVRCLLNSPALRDYQVVAYIFQLPCGL